MLEEHKNILDAWEEEAEHTIPQIAAMLGIFVPGNRDGRRVAYENTCQIMQAYRKECEVLGKRANAKIISIL